MIHDSCVYYYEPMVLLKVATLIHIWVDWFVGTWGHPVLSKGESRGIRVIFPMVRHPGPKGSLG